MFERPYTTVEGHAVPIELYILEQDTAEAKHLLDIKERDSHIMEKYFGEYPWIKEKIGIVEVPNSGMEHQTMISFKDSLTFRHFPGSLDYSDVFFHEYAHEWWANKITNKDWAYMWIQEGIATYSEALAMKEIGGENAYHDFMIRQRSNIRGKKPIVPEEGMNMNDINWDIYPKGAFLMHTLRCILGDSVFFSAIKKFVTDVKYPYEKFFTSDDVQRFFNRQTGKDLKPLFDFYLKTIKTIDINLRQVNSDTYYMMIENAPITSVPLEILTDSGILHTTMEATRTNPQKIISKTLPVIDPGGWYFKKVTYQ